jgi:hypothetical protein
MHTNRALWIMGLIECMVYRTLEKLGRVSMDRLAKVVFLIDKLGGFESLDWDRIDLVITSPEFINIIEELTRLGVLKITDNHVILTNNNYDPGCGWLEGKVRLTVDFVLSKYGDLSDGELDDVIESVLEGVY